MRARAALRWWIACCLLAAPLFAGAQQAVPALSGQVVDLTHTLDTEQAATVTRQLTALEQRTGAQVVVLLVESTLPEDITDYTQRVADVWKVGRASVGDGVLIVVAVKDRRARIAVAKTLEGAIPDLEARRIITQAMAPRFQAGDYAGGLRAGIERLGERIQSEGLPAPDGPAGNEHPGQEDSAPWWMAALMALVVVTNVLRAFLGRKGAAAVTGGVAGAIAWFATTSIAWVVGAALFGFLFALLFGAASLLHTLASAGRSPRGPVIFGSGFPGGGWRGGGGSAGGGWRSGGGGDFGGGGASGNW